MQQTQQASNRHRPAKMELFASITISRRDSDQDRLSAMQTQRVLMCYRVIGKKNFQETWEPCRGNVADSNVVPVVALTLEHLDRIGGNHLAACREAARHCRSAGREIYLCGVDRNRQGALSAGGLVEEIGARRIFANLRDLVASFADIPRHHPAGKAARPLSQALPAETDRGDEHAATR